MKSEKKPWYSSLFSTKEEKSRAVAVASSEPVGEAEPVHVVKGSIDVPFLLITVALILFGCVMIYSASSVYAEQYHDDSTYFITRHLFFLVMAIFLVIPII